MSGASERANERASGPVLSSQFLAVLPHSGLWRETKHVCNGKNVDDEQGAGKWKGSKLATINGKDKLCAESTLSYPNKYTSVLPQSIYADVLRARLNICL